MSSSNITVRYERHEYVTREGDANDRWDRDDTAADITINGISLVEGTKQYRDLTVPFEVVARKRYFLLWADYDTGDSFGRDGNQIEFIDLFESIDKADAARAVLEHGLNYDVSYIRESGARIKYHRPWVGYFECLNQINITPVYLLP